MADANIYFGPAGKLRKLWDPTGGMMATRELATSVFVTGSGGARTTKALNGSRQYTLNYGALGRKNFEYLNAIHQGAMGPGPFVLLDPGRRNLLTANQSAGTSLSNDTRHFTVAGTGGSLSSDSTFSVAFPRVLKWSFATSTPASATLTLDKPSSVWPGIPLSTPLIRPLTFWLMAIGSTGTVNFQLAIRWLDSAGATLSTATSSMITPSLTVWNEYALTATPPATAYYALCLILPDVSTIAAGEALNFSSLMLNEGGPDSDWQLGTGVYPVQTLSMPERYGFAEPGMLVQPVLVLQEVR